MNLKKRFMNGIFFDDVSVFKDNTVLKNFKPDQADWSVDDWIRFHQALIAYYTNYYNNSRPSSKEANVRDARQKATNIVYQDYMNLNFYSKPSLDCKGANYFAKFGIEKDFFTKLICAGVDIVDSTGTVIENIGNTAKQTASITTKIQNNIVPLAVLGLIGLWIFKKNKNEKKRK